MRDFVDSHLAIPGLPFTLADPITTTAIVDDRSLGDLNLAPAAILHFEWDGDVQAEWTRNGQRVRYLQEDQEGLE